MDKLVKYISKNWYKIYLLLSVLFIVFLYGFIAGNYHLPPYQTLHKAKLAIDDLFKDGNYKHYAKVRPEKFIHPAKYDGNGVTIQKPGKSFDGYTIVTSMWSDTSGLKLFDMRGEELHSWMVSYNEIFPADDTSKVKISDWDVDIHGSVVYPNGDIVFNFNGRGLVKINKDSEVIWKLKDDYHHSVFVDENDNLWVPGRKTHNDTVNSFLMLQPPFYEDYICKLSPEGKLLERFSLIEVFYESGMEALLFADGSWNPLKKAHDITHLNDIDILSSELAKNFPQFSEGDIMLSMRHLNLVMIIDPETKKIKWSMTGPYIRQHDPDFTEDGTIIVFDNRTDNGGGTIFGGSRIIEISPDRHEFKIVYEGNSDNPFYTALAGKQQVLPNGNILITEYEGGRIFEITQSNEIVWTFINRYDEDEVYSITEALRISKKYLTFLD